MSAPLTIEDLAVIVASIPATPDLRIFVARGAPPSTFLPIGPHYDLGIRREVSAIVMSGDVWLQLTEGAEVVQSPVPSFRGAPVYFSPPHWRPSVAPDTGGGDA